MNIPDELQVHVMHPTLLVVSDHMTAKTYLAHEDEVNEVEEVTAPRDPVQDSSENYTSLPEEERRKQFVRELADIVNPSLEAYGLANIHLVMPADVQHMLKAQLDPAILKLIRTETDGIHTKDDAVTILRKIFKA